MPATKTPSKTATHTGGVCAALVALQPSVVDAEAIGKILGGRTCKTLGEVAREFGVAEGTVRATWRANGMPGEPGKYPLAEIAQWRLQRNADNAKHAKSTSGNRLKEIELERAELELQDRQYKAMIREGEYCSRQQVRAELAALLTILRKGLQTIPRSMVPILPADVADSVMVELQKLITHQLVALSGAKCGGVQVNEGVATVKVFINDKETENE